MRQLFTLVFIIGFLAALPAAPVLAASSNTPACSPDICPPKKHHKHHKCKKILGVLKCISSLPTEGGGTVEPIEAINNGAQIISIEPTGNYCYFNNNKYVPISGAELFQKYDEDTDAADQYFNGLKTQKPTGGC